MHGRSAADSRAASAAARDSQEWWLTKSSSSFDGSSACRALCPTVMRWLVSTLLMAPTRHLTLRHPGLESGTPAYMGTAVDRAV